jgi:hypothetical protein
MDESSMDDYNRWLESQQQQQQQQQQLQQEAGEAEDDYEAFLRSLRSDSHDDTGGGGCVPYIVDGPDGASKKPSIDSSASHLKDGVDVGADDADTVGAVAITKDTSRSRNPSEVKANTEATKSHTGTGKNENTTVKTVTDDDYDADYFDVIVIGMQEATFDKEKKDKDKKTKSKSSSKNRNLSKGESLEDDDASLSASDDDEGEDADDDELMDADFDDSGIINDFFGHVDAEEQPKTKRNSASATVGKKLLGATVKAGKVGLKAGKVGLRASKKMGLATVKTAKTVNTLATARDHSKRPLPNVSSLEQDWREQHIMLEEGMGYPSGWVDTDVLHYRLEKDQLPEYKRAISYQLGEMRLLVYFRPSSDLTLDVLDINYQATGKGGLANKGGIVADVSINNNTRLSFLSAHLEAHEGEKKYHSRNAMLMDILVGTKSYIQLTSTEKSTTSSTKSKVRFDSSLTNHMMFVMGDLNYRTKLTDFKPGSPEHIQQTHSLVAKRDWITLNHCDELRRALQMKECLVGFETPYCGWNPTFKVSRCDGYEYNIKRSPSYTDRILFKANDQLSGAIRPLAYEPVEHFTTSDHKPIRSVFDIDLNDELIWKPAVPINQDADTFDKGRLHRKETGICVDARNLEQDDSDFDDRENMHFFISDIQCVIFPDEYDKIRKTEKAELPNPFVRFVSTPGEALQVDTEDTWKRNPWKILGFGGSKGQSSSSPFGALKPSKSPTVMSTKTSDGFPSTSTLKDAMRPEWKNENVHFTLKTHRDNGSPIDLSGAILYISLRDGKGASSSVIGTYSLNLSRLITVSREVERQKRPTTMPARLPNRSIQTNPRSNSKGHPSPFPTTGRGRMMRPEPRRPTNSTSKNDWNFSNPSSALRNVSSAAAGSSNFGGDATELLPSPVRTASRALQLNRQMKTAAATDQRLITDRRNNPNSRLQRQKRMDIVRTGSLRNAGFGPSQSLRRIMTIDKEPKKQTSCNDQSADNLNIMSLRLDEALTEGGLEVARIRCSIDIWWMKAIRQSQQKK